eukprot:3668035-Pleurochrysis_carterae.AAC.1
MVTVVAMVCGVIVLALPITARPATQQHMPGAPRQDNAIVAGAPSFVLLGGTQTSDVFETIQGEHFSVSSLRVTEHLDVAS